MDLFQSITSFQDFEAFHIDAILKDGPRFLWAGLNFPMDRCLVDHYDFVGLFDRYNPFCDARNSIGSKEDLEIGEEIRRYHVEQTYPKADALVPLKKECQGT